MTTITGTVAEGYEAVQAAFEANFTEHEDVGAAVAVYVDGECVVDLQGGEADPTTGRAYDADTLQLVFSTTKGAAAICGHLLAQRGHLDFAAPVTSVWPEYGQAGKEATTIGDLFSHRGGVPVIERDLSLSEALAVDPIIKGLAESAPVWEPGTAHGYHALTYGWLVGEIVRRIDGRDIGTFFAEEVAGPLGLDFWIGLPDEQQARVAPLQVAVPQEGGGFDMANLDPEILPLLQDLGAAYMNPNSVTNRALSLSGTFAIEPGGDMVWNRPEVRASQIPAAAGVTNANSLAKLYAACVGEVDGIRLLDDASVARATEVRSEGRDQVLIVPTKFGLGFFLPSKFSPLMGEGSFGHAGAGGSLGFANTGAAGAKVGFGYVMNQMGSNLSDDPRTGGLIAALQGCIR